MSGAGFRQTRGGEVVTGWGVITGQNDNTMSRTSLIALLLVVPLTCPRPADGALLLNSSDPALAGSKLLDFNSESHGTFTCRTFGEVTFTVLDDGRMAVTDAWKDNLFGYGMQQSHLTTCEYPFQEGDLSTGLFQIDFATPVSAFGFMLGAADLTWYPMLGEPWTFQVYDGMRLAETLTLPRLYTTNIGTGFVGATGTRITRVEVRVGRYTFNNRNDNDLALIDNLHYVASPVPEPSSLAFWSVLGMMGIIAARRRAGRAVR